MGTSARPGVAKPAVPVPTYLPPGPVAVPARSGGIDWGAVWGGVNAVGSVVGAERANRANAKQAKDQMAFQERMANTSAQRGKADYEAAGLNPALAYDKGAASPSGASATLGNALGGLGEGISNGLKAREQRALLNATLSKMQVDTAVSAIDGQSKMIEQDQRIEDVVGKRISNARGSMVNQQLTMMQPQQLRKIVAENALLESQQPGARAQAESDTMLGKWGKMLPLITGSLRAVKGF